jgi:two-component system, cell cycle sensor histidine kinase and response regulator CckA
MPRGDIYARVFENALIGLLVLDKATGRILQANAAFLRMAGRCANEVMGRGFWEPPLVADRDAGAEVHKHLVAGGTITAEELPLKAADGHWLLVEVSGIATGGLIQLEVCDATGREQARLSDRIETLRSSARRTATEFQNLHRALFTVGELLLVGSGQSRTALRELEEVQHAGARARAIANELLAFSGGVALQPQPVSLNVLVESMLPRLRQLFGRDIEIALDLSPDMTQVVADPAQLRQVILKLAVNAREAMAREGTFCMQTGNSPTVEPGLGIPEVAGGPYGMLVLSDSGPGLDDQSWVHLYEPFFTTKNGGSLGLGLAAVYGIVRESGGRLWASSRPGQGTTFRIYLPTAVEESVGPHFPALPASGTDLSPRDITILLVEANDGMRTVMANLLKKRGYHVLAAIDSKEALRVADAVGPPDLLISRPEPELAIRLARAQPQLRVLYLGGYLDALVAEQQGLPPRSSLLQKPFDPETFLGRVLDLLSEPL